MKLQMSPLKSEIWAGSPLLPLPINTAKQILTSTVKKKKNIQKLKRNKTSLLLIDI